MQDIRQLDFVNIFFYQKNELCMVHLVFIFKLHKVRYFKISLLFCFFQILPMPILYTHGTLSSKLMIENPVFRYSEQGP